MATFVKYNQFVEDLSGKVHDLFGTAGSGADVCKVLLSNAAPNAATHVVRADTTELSTANGYTSGGAATTSSRSSASDSLRAPLRVRSATSRRSAPTRSRPTTRR